MHNPITVKLRVFCGKIKLPMMKEVWRMFVVDKEIDTCSYIDFSIGNCGRETKKRLCFGPYTITHNLLFEFTILISFVIFLDDQASKTNDLISFFSFLGHGSLSKYFSLWFLYNHATPCSYG